MNIIDTRLNTFNELVKLIKEEDEKQVQKWGIQDRHIFEWAMWISEEFGEFIQAINEQNYERVHDEPAYNSIIKEGVQTITLISKMVCYLIQEQQWIKGMEKT